MPFPQFPGKYDDESVTTPRGGDLDDEPPESVILCYQPSLFEHVVEEHAANRIEGWHGLMDCYTLTETGGRVGVAGNFGIGAPVTALMMEELIAGGVETFLSAGYVGCLQSEIVMEDIILADQAIRDEGTSHHYLQPAKYVEASESLLAHLRNELAERDVTVHEGATWTIDAAFRETAAEVKHYAGEDVLAVEMEAAATFAVAEYHGVEAGAMFVVSDYLGPEEWDPRFHLTDEHLERLFRLAKETLASHTSGDNRA